MELAVRAMGAIILGLAWAQIAPLIAGPSDAWSALTWVLFLSISGALGYGYGALMFNWRKPQ